MGLALLNGTWREGQWAASTENLQGTCKEFADGSGKRMMSVLMKDEQLNTQTDTEIEVTKEEGIVIIQKFVQSL